LKQRSRKTERRKLRHYKESGHDVSCPYRMRGVGGLRERADEQDELPALVFGEAGFEAGHGAAAFGDLVEDFAIGERRSGFGVGEVGGERVVELGFGAIAFAGRAMAIGAFLFIHDTSGMEIGFGGLKRIDTALGGFGDDPLAVVLVEGERNGDEDQEEEPGE
jgi:hypothetical protein